MFSFSSVLFNLFSCLVWFSAFFLSNFLMIYPCPFLIRVVHTALKYGLTGFAYFVDILALKSMLSVLRATRGDLDIPLSSSSRPHFPYDKNIVSFHIIQKACSPFILLKYSLFFDSLGLYFRLLSEHCSVL